MWLRRSVSFPKIHAGAVPHFNVAGIEVGGPASDRRIGAIRALPLDEFLKLDVKPRAQLLAPIIPEKGLAMLYARGAWARPSWVSASPTQSLRRHGDAVDGAAASQGCCTSTARCRWRLLQERLRTS